VRVAIVGGTGAFGRALAKRLQEIGKDEVLVGSRDAGLYVGQSQNVVVRYNSVHGNVAGLHRYGRVVESKR
jgi:predicted dinucleotide-binding enzyme